MTSNPAPHLEKFQIFPQSNTESHPPALHSIYGIGSEDLRQLRSTFDLYDVHRDGTIDPKEVQVTLLSLSLETQVPYVYKLLAGLDKFGERRITFDEFVEVVSTGSTMTHSLSADGKLSMNEINMMFRLLDEESKGSININNLRRTCIELGETIPPTEMAEMIRFADSDGDGEVTKDDFADLLSQRIRR